MDYTVIDFLEDNDIEYSLSGKNISKGWIGLQCPFCDDSSNHLGIRLSDLRVKCWICGGHSKESLIKTLTDCSWTEAKTVGKRLAEGVDDNPPPENRSRADKCHHRKLPLPHHFQKPSGIYKKYLRSRGFKPKQVIKKYRLLEGGHLGRYKFRLIIPIYLNRKFKSFTSRDITNQQSPKYLNANKTDFYSVKELVYNYDAIDKGGNVLVVEGPTDVWKIGGSTVCLFGVEYTDQQIVLLAQKEINNLYILFDSDSAGVAASKKLKRVLYPLANSVEILSLKKGDDPGQLSLSEARSIKYELKL